MKPAGMKASMPLLLGIVACLGASPACKKSAETSASPVRQEATAPQPAAKPAELVRGPGADPDAPDPNLEAGALPFSIGLSDASVEGVPNIHSYQVAVAGDSWLVVGGRIAGLHTFTGHDDFPVASRNDSLWVISPTRGTLARLPVSNFPSQDLQRLFTSTNAQSYMDGDVLYVLGGYGPTADAPPRNMGTQDTIAKIPVQKVIDVLLGGGTAADQAQKIQSLISVQHDPYFQVTGGALFKLSGVFYLVLGQRFTGNYAAFDSIADQVYTEQIRLFSLDGAARPLAKGAIVNSDPSRPFHRRDGNVFEDVDPASGAPRITASGGVFPVGRIAGFTQPIYVSADQRAQVDASFEQRFSAYDCPVVVAYSQRTAAAYRTYFAGISHYFYHFTAQQRQVYDSVTKEGRNDGLPFISDITTVAQTQNGPTTEWIHPNTMPGARLVGSSVPFIPSPAAIASGVLDRRGVVQLDALEQGVRTTIGWIYGGILAANPLPIKPNTGTAASGAIYEVTITLQDTAAIPASKGTEALSTTRAGTF